LKQTADDGDLEAAIEKALEVGYRHIDTAPVYDNEKLIGKILKKWMDSGRIRREELFIVTKVIRNVHCSCVKSHCYKVNTLPIYMVELLSTFVAKSSEYRQ